ncbi:FAD/NAD(P)-binding oxidoreductase [Kiritimatiellaeota bacterium B1221]|nr:FAD/NAD(P)-binding oxidoreductase [Kiritimatiellaeota bacterium B1221]
MKTHSNDYLIVGGGMAADAAIRAICEREPEADIALLSSESSLPYDRPPLSKSLLTDPEATADAVIADPEPYESTVQVFLGRRAERLEPSTHCVMDNRGERHGYGKLLLATGGTPRKLPQQSQRVICYRTLSDYKRLEAQIAPGQRIAIIGDGFIGSEIAASLAQRDCDPFMIFPHAHIGADRFPESLAMHLDELYQSHAVDLLPGQRVTGIESSGESLVVVTDGGGRYAADFAVAGMGIDPNVDLAIAAGLKVDDGIRVNDHLQTSHPDIYAAGDNASAYRKELDRYERIEHEMNAIKMGKAAGRAMAGDEEVSFAQTPLFYSDIFDQGFEAVGDLNADLDMIEDWQDGLNKGVVYYLEDKKIQGVLLWNIFGKTDEARTLMRGGPIENPKSLKNRIRG